MPRPSSARCCDPTRDSPQEWTTRPEVPQQGARSRPEGNVTMSEQVTLSPKPAPATPADPPAWLRRKFLGPTEPVLWWQGPTESRWVEWVMNHEEWLVFAGFACTM